MGRAFTGAAAALLAAIVVVGVPQASTGAGQSCDGCLKVRYWPVRPDAWKTERKDASDFPERQMPGEMRPTSFGVAFSGGGTRSAAATVGQLRGLARNEWLDRVAKEPRLSRLQKQFERFPWFATFEENKPYVIKLSAAQVNVLADLAEWSITNPVSAARIQALFGNALLSGAK